MELNKYLIDFNNLKFNRVNIKKLIIGDTYLIKTYIGRQYESRKGIFVNGIFLNKHVYFRMRLIQGFSYVTYCLDDSSYFYEIVSRKKLIQDSMELRALNKILRRIVGDETFVYK
uniref:Uncharacterized protein n=1 Tax=viral metagenome TaxID=1070528 RepID=A0A6C0EUJ1_9ZZZZ